MCAIDLYVQSMRFMRDKNKTTGYPMVFILYESYALSFSLSFFPRWRIFILMGVASREKDFLM